MPFLRTDGFDTSAGDAETPMLGKIRAVLEGRRTMLMRAGALAIGVVAFAVAAQATVADDDDWGDDDGGYYLDVWGGGYYGDDDYWIGGDDDGWGDDDWGDDD